MLFNLLFKSQWQIMFDTKLKKLYVLNLVVEVFFSDVISEEPMLQFEYLHIHEPITCMGMNVIQIADVLFAEYDE